MDFSLDLYKYFYTVAKYKSMTKASIELNVTQPAISKAIKQLELQLSVSLFNRSNKGLELTKEGESLFERIKPALELLSNAETELSEYKLLNTGKITIGISSVLTKCLLLEVISNFRLKYPNIKFNIKNGLNETLIQELNEGKLDFVIFNRTKSIPTNIDYEKITSLKYSLIYNDNYFKLKEIKNIEELNNFPLILQEKESNTRKYIDLYTENKLIPSIEASSQDLICQMIYNGLGIGICFENLTNLSYNSLTKLELSQIPPVDILLAKNKNLKTSFATKTFIKELKNNL